VTVMYGLLKRSAFSVLQSTIKFCDIGKFNYNGRCAAAAMLLFVKLLWSLVIFFCVHAPGGHTAGTTIVSWGVMPGFRSSRVVTSAN